MPLSLISNPYLTEKSEILDLLLSSSASMCSGLDVLMGHVDRPRAGLLDYFHNHQKLIDKESSRRLAVEGLEKRPQSIRSSLAYLEHFNSIYAALIRLYDRYHQAPAPDLRANDVKEWQTSLGLQVENIPAQVLAFTERNKEAIAAERASSFYPRAAAIIDEINAEEKQNDTIASAYVPNRSLDNHRIFMPKKAQQAGLG